MHLSDESEIGILISVRDSSIS